MREDIRQRTEIVMDTTKERAQLIAEIARELYDRFVMGGWEPQDAYAQIGEWLARAEQSTETPPRWIPVEERLPERSGEYLIVETGDVEATAADFFIEVEHIRKSKWMTVRTFGVDSEERELYGVTHWMPIPAAPVAEAPRPVGTPRFTEKELRAQGADPLCKCGHRHLGAEVCLMCDCDECLAAFAASETAAKEAALIELQADAFENQRQEIEALKSERAAAEAERDRAVRALEFLKSYNRGIYDCAIKFADEPVPAPVPQIDTGDIVKHGPTGETWTVAYVRGEYLAWCGWPEGEAKLSDCTLVEKVSPEARLDLLHKMAEMPTDDARRRYARQVAGPAPTKENQ